MKHEKRNILKGVLAFSMAILMFMTAIPTTLHAEGSEERYFDKEPVSDYAYSFAVVGDTQIVTANDVRNGKEHLLEMYDWIVANKDEKKIKYVFGLGDITDKTDVAQWEHATKAIQKLDGEIPYSVIRGNHDLPGWIGDTNDKTDYFTQKLGTESYKSQFPENGFYEAGNIFNSWRTLTVGTIDYLLLALDHGASDDVLAWASDIIEQHPYHNVIITTHAYLGADGTTLDTHDSSRPTSSKGSNDGDDMWSQLVSQHDNIVLVMSGHDPSETIVVSRDKGVYGNFVTSMLIDPQGVDAAEGSTGMVAMLYFSEDGRKVQVEYYSTVHGKYFLQENQFSFELEVVDKFLADVTNAGSAKWAEVELQDGATIFTTGGAEFINTPTYLKGLYFIHKNNWSSLTATVTANCYAYILADEALVESLEKAGFTRVQTYKKTDIWKKGGYYYSNSSISTNLYLLEKQVKAGDEITYGDGKWAILMTSRKQLTMPHTKVTNAGNNATWAEAELQDGATIFTTGGAEFVNTPTYLKGLYFIHKNNWASLTATVTANCYAYILADEALVEPLEKAGFTHVKTYRKTDIWTGYYATNSSISTNLHLLEKQVKVGDEITYGDDTQNLWAILMTSRKQLTMPLVDVKTYDSICAEVTLESGARILANQTSDTGSFGVPPAYLVGLCFFQKKGTNDLTATVTADCYAYILADERLVATLEAAGFTQVQTYTKKELWKSGYHLNIHQDIPNKLCLFEKQVKATEEITYGGGWAILMTSRTQLETPPMLKGNSVTLDGEIGINYYVYLNDALAADTDRVTMQFTLPNSTEPMVVEECTRNDDYNAYVFTCDIPAKHMADEIAAQVYVDGVACDDEYKLSVMKYGNTLLNDNTQSEKIKNLVKSMLHYGAYSQVYFNYNPDARADAGLEELNLAAVTQSNFEKTIQTEEEGFGKIVSSNLNLKSETALNLYFELADGVDGEDYTFMCDGKVLEKDEYKGLLTVKIPNIAAHELDEIFTIEVIKSGESESSVTFKYSVFTYAYKALDANATVRAGLTDLMKAMWLYNYAAKELLGSK